MIDKSTVNQIIDTADIVEVVSDFVNLRRRGANYVGLCPFHNEKTPSFSVSKAKGICKCFSCGKGGSPLNFIMEHEQLSYYEALKYLAKKYRIEINERELTDSEREAQSERESMFIVNDFAAKHFENTLTNTNDGQDIGRSYFYERGFSDITIRKFQLGYSTDSKDTLFNAAISQGYNSKFLFSTGLCIDNSHGGGYDRFKGRVMFPVHNIAGKVVAFGGRTLKKDLAKYVNSPESLIYKKSNELYGLYQAKQSIVKKEKCFLVEGYTDVISMHQAGIENVVASSGTALTEGQIRMIHRFTDNVTVLYDGDAAGIKASIRGIDLLLAEGLNIKVLLLPDGDDPDSFARKHNASDFQKYIDENETDFIQFKTKILLDGVENDPIKRSAAIGDIVKSIAVIPFQINQNVYIQECSRILNISENILLNEVNKIVQATKEKALEKSARSQREDTTSITKEEEAIPVATGKYNELTTCDVSKVLYPYEEALIRYVVKYGFGELCLNADSPDNKLFVIDFINNELDIDRMKFSIPIFIDIFDLACRSIPTFTQSLNEKMKELELIYNNELNNGIEEIRISSSSISDIESKENALKKRLTQELEGKVSNYRIQYLERLFCSHENDAIRKLSLELVNEKHRLSKIHTKFAVIQSEYECLITLIPTAINNWKNAIVDCRIKEIQNKIKSAKDSNIRLLKELQNLYALRSQLASYLGDRIVIPKS